MVIIFAEIRMATKKVHGVILLETRDGITVISMSARNLSISVLIRVSRTFSFLPKEKCKKFNKSTNKKCNDPCVEGKGETYNGVISKTASGYTCQRWDSKHPHVPKVRPDPAGAISNNFITLISLSIIEPYSEMHQKTIIIAVIQMVMIKDLGVTPLQK